MFEYVRMCHTQDYVHNGRLSLDYSRHRLEHHLDPLVLVKQAECQNSFSVFHAEFMLVVVAVNEGQIRYTVCNQFYLLAGYIVNVPQHTDAAFVHSDYSIRGVAQLHTRFVVSRVWFINDCMKGCYDGGL